jgi:hypothetical protein
MQVKADSTFIAGKVVHERIIALVPILVIAALAFAAYRPTLFNFFCGDDYIHVEWLARAVHDPSLIWRNFYGSWLDDRCALYYRPFVSLSFVGDYLIWGENGLGFRITNILLLLAAAAMLFLIIRDLPKEKEAGQVTSDVQWALLASALFVLYPLHPEAIVWITGRVDCLVAALYLASVWCYIRWRRGNSWLWLAAGAMMMISALCSKEMGISLPLAFVAYEIVYGRLKGRHFSGRAVIAANVFFFCLLGFYFYLRSLFLGSAVGGWNNALAVDWQSIRVTWSEGFRKMILPLNDDVFHNRRTLAWAWDVLVLAVSAASLARFRLDKARARDACFFLLLFGACMLPVYKVFNISGDLESSRYAYLGTAPLCALISAWFGIDQTFSRFSGRVQTWLTRASYVAAGLSLVLAFLVLRLNCLPWRTAGQEANAVREALRLINGANRTHKPIVLLEYPDNFEGAYVCRNAIVGLAGNSKPNLWTTPPIPFGILRNQLKTFRDAVLVYQWDTKSLAFKKVEANLANRPCLQKTWKGEELRQILSADSSPGVTLAWQANGALSVECGNKNAILHLDFSGVDPGSIDFLALDLKALDARSDLTKIDLHFVSDCCSDGNIQPVKVNNAGKELLVFPVHGLMEWTFAHKLLHLDITLPPNSNLVLQAVKSLTPPEIIPLTSPGVADRTFFDGNGVIRLNGSSQNIPLAFNAIRIAGAKQLLVDISKPNYMFVHPNLPETSPALILKTLKVPVNYLNLPVSASLFPQAGFYQIRATALDRADKAVGLPSDHLVFFKL